MATGIVHFDFRFEINCPLTFTIPIMKQFCKELYKFKMAAGIVHLDFRFEIICPLPFHIPIMVWIRKDLS